MYKVKLTREQETLLIPLYIRAEERKRDTPILNDKKAGEILEKIEYDFSSLKVPVQTHITICMRARQFDSYTKEFLRKNPRSTVINLGCGLDSRFERLDNGEVRWYDLDFPQVIKLRSNFYGEGPRNHFISSSVMEFGWIREIKEGNKLPVIILAEGLFMYMKEREVKELLKVLQKSFPGSYLVFDCFSRLTAKNISRHPSLQKTGARVYWGIDDIREMEKWGRGISLIEEWHFTRSEEVLKLNFWHRLAFKLASFIPQAKNAHRIGCLKLQ